VPVYSVNIAAVAALPAALDDHEFLAGYLSQVTQSKAMLYEACDRLGVACWKSDANFVLVRAGDRLDALMQAAAAHGIYLRDRSTEPGCEGCVRIGAGIVEHTRRVVAVLEEGLCAAR
jgi:histidinol-phosphate aminotransferase